MSIQAASYNEIQLAIIITLFVTRMALTGLTAAIFFSTMALFPPLLRGKAFQIVNISAKIACSFVQPFAAAVPNFTYAITILSMASLVIMS